MYKRIPAVLKGICDKRPSLSFIAANTGVRSIQMLVNKSPTQREKLSRKLNFGDDFHLPALSFIAVGSNYPVRLTQREIDVAPGQIQPWH